MFLIKTQIQNVSCGKCLSNVQEKKQHRGFNSQCEKEEGVIIMFRKRVVNPGVCRFCKELA